MAISKHFNGNVELTKQLKGLSVGSFIILDINLDNSTVQKACNAVTSNPLVRVNKTSTQKDHITIKVKLEVITGISGKSDDKLSKLIKIERTE